MKSQACEPCAKRKVRCDKGKQCSNCKRRKQYRCSYLDISPFERIKRLEASVRKLGGDPESDVQNDRQPTLFPSQTKPISQLQYDAGNSTKSNEDISSDPVILEGDGKPFYLESCVCLPSDEQDG